MDPLLLMRSILDSIDFHNYGPIGAQTFGGGYLLII